MPRADGSTLRLTGYGIDLTPVGCTGYRNSASQTEQTRTGPYQELDGTTLWYVVDTEGGDSGSPVRHQCENVIYAIHTWGACGDPDVGANAGTAIDHPGLRDALIPNSIDGGTREPTGVLADCNDNGASDAQDIAAGTSADCNANRIPDECEPNEDCQPNSIRDICDIATGSSLDLNGNRVPDECEGPVSACCATNGVCLVLRQTCCTESGGTFAGDGTTCAPTGGCCVGGNSCEILSEACCAAVGGAFAATITSCPAFPREGACCVPEGSCESLLPVCCESAGGTFKGQGTLCDDLPGDPYGACCLPSGECLETFQSCCAAEGGLFAAQFHCGGSGGPPYVYCM